MRIGWLAGLLGLVMAAATCSDDADTTGDGGSAGSSSSGEAGSGGTIEYPDESCVVPGDEGNNLGVGEFCTPGGDECDDFNLAPACLANFGQDQWFCTRIGCDETTDCGEDAECLLDGAGSACVPCRCSDHCGGAGAGGGTGGSGGNAAGGGGAGGN